MKVAIKYLICLAGFWGAFASICSCGSSVGSGITAAGAFIAFALLEINDLKILNEEDKD
jgi:hypothetical protein